MFPISNYSTNTNTTATTTDLISSSASSSSSSSPFSHLPNNIKTIEDVWNDINISSLTNTPNPPNYSTNIHNNTNNMVFHPTPSTNFRGMILQDFLNCNPQSISAVDSHHDDAPTTALQLTTTDFQHFFHSNANYSAFDALAGGDTVTRKRSSESTPENANVDRRSKRMIKNRESAARSRARKQAYIMELELEVAHLVDENTRLRKQQQQLLEVPSTQPPKKHGLHRTSTAPF